MLYWFVVGVIYLSILTYQDYKNRMWVDSRYNWFMSGLSFGLIPLLHPRGYFVIVLLFVVLGLNLFLRYALKTYFGRADIHSLTWIFWGFGLLGTWPIFSFLMSLSFCSGLYVLLKKVVFRKQLMMVEKTPFYPVLLISFIFAGYLGGLI